MNKAILWGGTGQAKVVRRILEAQGIKVIAVIDDTPNLKKTFSDIPLYKGFAEFANYIGDGELSEVGFVVTIGNNKACTNSKARIKLSEYCKSLSLIPLSAIHKDAFIDIDVTLGKCLQVHAGAKIISESVIGDCCIINTGANVDHECVLEKGVEISPNATLCGLVHVGENSWIGANATILPRINIGKNCVIGAGAVVTKDVPDNTIVAGNPARVLEEGQNGNYPASPENI